MDSKREVEKSPDAKTDEDFPGYPHYPAKEDIMDQRTGSHRVDADLEQMGTGPNATRVSERFPDNQQAAHAQQDAEGEKLGMDGNNEEIGLPQNVSNEDLGSNLPGTDVEEAADKGSTNP